jgi:hypothetical protein
MLANAAKLFGKLIVSEIPAIQNLAHYDQDDPRDELLTL